MTDDMAYRIMLVEDDFALAMGTEYALQAEGYEVLRAGTIAQARTLLTENVSLILLDVMLPDGSGYDFCKEIRRQGRKQPVIFLTALSEEANIVQGLELGADDYISKPYRVKELLSRIGANLRRLELSNGRQGTVTAYRFGGHRFVADEFRLFHEEKPVECPVSELKLLRELIANRGLAITRRQLLERLFDTEDVFIDDNTLSVYLKRLRDRLGEDARYIETIRGVGYRFRREEGMF